MLLVPAVAAAAEKADKEDTIFSRIDEARKGEVNLDAGEMTKSAEEGTNKLWLIAKAYSLPGLVVALIVSAVMIFLSALFGPGLKRMAGGLIFASIVAFILINFAPEITGKILSVIDSLISTIGS